MTQLKEGVSAPVFRGKDQDEKWVGLEDFRGKKVILYFYPKDDTPGCTDEACNLRDNYEALLSRGFSILGVSPDNEKSHAKFKAKFELPFSLISDPETKILNAYGVWGEKSLFGQKYMGVLRTTFVIDEAGIIRKIISNVDTRDHTRQILEELKIN
ncbi:MAG TPA: thioredoxin-dependent thiol peroxidase [Bacteroidales bacterium]|nr:thioredoxin-dependent thiol peroxidase [Bacteroidales bacterium]